MTSTPIQFRPGFIIQTIISTGGGVHYTRHVLDVKQADHDGDGSKEHVQKKFETVKTTDNVHLVRESWRVVGKARSVLSKHAIGTPIGFYCDADSKEKLEQEWQSVVDMASAFNRKAMDAGSGRRVHCAIIPLPLQLDNAAAAREICRHVRETLTEAAEALRSGDLDGSKKVLPRLKELPGLATGVQGDALALAVNAAVAARKELKRLVKDAGRDPENAGKSLDLEAVETAVQLFDPDAVSIPVDAEAFLTAE